MTIERIQNGLDSGLLAGKRWTDKSFALTRDRQGVAQKPDYDFVNRGLLFPQNDPTEYVQIIDQMDHAKYLEDGTNKEGMEIRMHVHFIQTVAALPIYKIDYKWWNNGESIPASDITLSTADGLGPAFAWAGVPMIQIIRFPYIFFDGIENISSHFECNIYRDDNIISGDVLTKYFDYHWAKDSDGSRLEFVK